MSASNEYWAQPFSCMEQEDICLFPFSEEPGNFYCMEDRKLYDALYYYPDNTLGKKELNLEKGQV